MGLLFPDMMPSSQTTAAPTRPGEIPPPFIHARGVITEDKATGMEPQEAVLVLL
jgi:hypothetical protein